MIKRNHYEDAASMAAGWPDKDDQELLALIQDGSHQAFAELVQRHTERFYRLAYRYAQNRETAEDLVQDAFVRLWENPASWRPDRNSKFTTWFYRIVVNLCLDWQKKNDLFPWTKTCRWRMNGSPRMKP